MNNFKKLEIGFAKLSTHTHIFYLWLYTSISTENGTAEATTQGEPESSTTETSLASNTTIKTEKTVKTSSKATKPEKAETTQAEGPNPTRTTEKIKTTSTKATKPEKTETTPSEGTKPTTKETKKPEKTSTNYQGTLEYKQTVLYI